VYPGLICAKCAVNTINKALKIGDCSENTLKEYEICWRNTIGKELKYASYLHRIYTKIRDEEFDKIINLLNDEKAIKIINEEGDIDYPSRVMLKLFRKKPSLLKYISIPARPYRK
jgi:digeranylgeranylglycerophospholipid reductase